MEAKKIMQRAVDRKYRKIHILGFDVERHHLCSSVVIDNIFKICLSGADICVCVCACVCGHAQKTGKSGRTAVVE